MLSELWKNTVLWIALSSWCAAEILKTIIYWIMNRKLDLSRLIGDGGYPSAHSALVTSLATGCARVYGLDSGLFAIAAVLAVIVMHDAHGVRLETGKQAQTINSIVELFEHLFDEWKPDNRPNQKLKEMIGHTPMQVAAGAVVGLGVALAWPL